MSRAAFGADLVLLLIGTLGWRAGRVLWLDRRAPDHVPTDRLNLIDRATDQLETRPDRFFSAN